MNPGYDAVKMTDGEYRTLLKKMFSQGNVIISVSSSVKPEYFIELFSRLQLPDADISDNVQYNAEISLNEYAVYTDDAILLSELTKSFFVAPEYLIIDANSIMMPIKVMNAQKDIRNALMPSAYVNKNALSVINALSMYLFNDPSYILSILK